MGKKMRPKCIARHYSAVKKYLAAVTIGIYSKDMHVESKKEFMIAESRMVVIEEESPSCRMNRCLVHTAWWVSLQCHTGHWGRIQGCTHPTVLFGVTV